MVQGLDVRDSSLVITFYFSGEARCLSSDYVVPAAISPLMSQMYEYTRAILHGIQSMQQDLR